MEIMVCLVSVILFTCLVLVKLEWNKGHDCGSHKYKMISKFRKSIFHEY